MRTIDRAIKASRKLHDTPPLKETDEYMMFFEQMAKGLFDAEIIEVFSSKVFPETLVTKKGEKYLVWDNSYWYIVTKLLELKFLEIFAKSRKSKKRVSQHMEANLMYFLSLINKDKTFLSVETARSYRELIQKKYDFKLSENQVKVSSQSISEILFIAKIYCLCHELNHIDFITDKGQYENNLETLQHHLLMAKDLLEEDSNLLKNVYNYYSKDDLLEAINNMISKNDSDDLEVEIICDMVSIFDTIEFFKDTNDGVEDSVIYGKVNEAILLVNSINFALLQSYQYWNCLYSLFNEEITVEQQHKFIDKLNKDTFVRFVFSDMLKTIDTIGRLGEEFTHVLHSNHYGLRNEKEHSILQSVMWSITDKKFLFQIFKNTMKYEISTENRIEQLRDSLLGW